MKLGLFSHSAVLEAWVCFLYRLCGSPQKLHFALRGWFPCCWSHIPGPRALHLLRPFHPGSCLHLLRPRVPRLCLGPCSGEGYPGTESPVRGVMKNRMPQWNFVMRPQMSWLFHFNISFQHFITVALIKPVESAQLRMLTPRLSISSFIKWG